MSRHDKRYRSEAMSPNADALTDGDHRENSIHGADGDGTETDDTDADNGDNGADADVDLQGQH